MSNLNWIETKQECEVGEGETLIVKRVTREVIKKKYFGLDKKDIIDIFLRVIGLAAIFIPVMLFFQQQKAERDKQKALFQLSVYSSTTTLLHSLLNKEVGSHEFDDCVNEILYGNYPKLVLLNDNVVNSTFKPIKNNVEFSAIMSNLFKTTDFFYTIFDSIMYLTLDKKIHSYPTSPDFLKRNYMIKSKVLSYLQQVNYIKEKNNQSETSTLNDFETKSSKLLNDLNDAIMNFNNEIYAQQQVDQSSEITNLRDKLSLFKENYRVYNTDFLSRNIPYLDSVMIASNEVLYNR